MIDTALSPALAHECRRAMAVNVMDLKKQIHLLNEVAKLQGQIARLKTEKSAIEALLSALLSALER